MASGREKACYIRFDVSARVGYQCSCASHSSMASVGNANADVRCLRRCHRHRHYPGRRSLCVCGCDSARIRVGRRSCLRLLCAAALPVSDCPGSVSGGDGHAGRGFQGPQRRNLGGLRHRSVNVSLCLNLSSLFPLLRGVGGGWSDGSRRATPSGGRRSQGGTTWSWGLDVRLS